MLRPGQLVGSYRIVARLGEGGFATVYRAVHEQLATEHAIKVLSSECAANEDIRSRFLKEARIQATLRHPNMVRVTDILNLPEVTALVMDVAPGEPLDEWLAVRRAPPSSVQLRQIILPLLDALGHVHAQGVVHRDLKPENVQLETTQSGVLVPRLLDFGIAKLLGDSAPGSNKRSTIANTKLGTLGYMSPEHIRSPKNVDHRSDIFALGILLLELATLKHPFNRDSDYDTQHAVVTGDYEIPRDLWKRDPAVASAIRVALQTKPEDRFPDCGGFALAINPGAMPTGARPGAPTTPQTAPSPAAKRRTEYDPPPKASSARVPAAPSVKRRTEFDPPPSAVAVPLSVPFPGTGASSTAREPAGPDSTPAPRKSSGFLDLFLMVIVFGLAAYAVYIIQDDGGLPSPASPSSAIAPVAPATVESIMSPAAGGTATGGGRDLAVAEAPAALPSAGAPDGAPPEAALATPPGGLADSVPEQGRPQPPDSSPPAHQTPASSPAPLPAPNTAAAAADAPPAPKRATAPPKRAAMPPKEAPAQGTVKVFGDVMSTVLIGSDGSSHLPGLLAEGAYTVRVTFPTGVTIRGTVTVNADKTVVITCSSQMQRCGGWAGSL